ncbi:MacB family efflux pump subunit [Marinospirillum alkaliphilum]|uniref:Macrolide transport system ATP-binding/permease protein n=1 Tax=Marinospirillum alkaliphilum DSM 21637 TaxID=1122209 RepID=A0A1K1UXC5_9GAMM|nr:MacB family efflux pump subunit [Marinospirillum alkaliphilum]SFX17171.1 macrolide transport system ATP-binding/permease protein [Marinospirillum alkaliphilum DSM 21637]
MINAVAPPLIQLQGLTRSFSNGDQTLQVLKGLDLTIHDGEFVAIIGSSGSGKSTLMNLLGCLDRPTSGEYLFRGQPVSTLSKDELARLRREAFGFVFQSYHLLPGTPAVNNVELPAIYAGEPPAERRQRALELLARLGLSDRAWHLPGQLSGGQQQRVSIARALMNGGQVILADEPTGALDSHSGQEVMKLLRELSDQGHTLLLITHDPEVAAHADRIIEIRDGEIIHDSGSSIQTSQQHTPGASRERPLLDIWEATKAAFTALHRNLFRTLLTLLGIVIGVASVIAMLAIGDGARHEVVERISAMGSNLLLVRPGGPNQRGRWPATLVPEDVTAINQQIPNLLAAIPELSRSATLRYGNQDASTEINATSADFPIARQWPVAQGTFFSHEDDTQFATVAVIGQTVARNLFPGRSPLGEYVMADGTLLQVIGVMSARGASPMGQDQDDVVLVPFNTGSLRIFGQRHLRNVTVAVDDVSRMDETEAAIHSLLLARHGIEDFQIRNMASLIDNVTETQNTFTLLLGSVAAISLLVGGVGVMNIMLVSVTERTREIGIRLATGARTRNILQQFLIEALTISALGGLIGVAIGLGTAWLVGYLGTAVHFSVFPVVLAFCCAFATGLIFGYLPARKAAHLDPVRALSTE